MRRAIALSLAVAVAIIALGLTALGQMRPAATISTPQASAPNATAQTQPPVISSITPTSTPTASGIALEKLGAGNYEVNYTVYLKLCAGSVCFQMRSWAIYGEGPPGNYTYGIFAGKWPSLGEVTWEMWGATEGNKSYGITKMCIADLCANETFLPVITRVTLDKPLGECEVVVNGTKLKGVLSVRAHEAEFLDIRNGHMNETTCFFNGIPLRSEAKITGVEDRTAYVIIEAVWLRAFDEARFREILQIVK
ncbi:hypothetical protein Pogu_1193 [Pyrobaculum oguniense TE7]|uniref:Uncharacterized protein n=1 Tax=Pyrobaculum oguniense (strain DSM 13380 / JCM 10595 / TE7) TaxID=698757 RepID=H6Q8R5_PYROT|nr:hypothetical protein Pogu_1193 [Pyrobaculum oguniense TE7]